MKQKRKVMIIAMKLLLDDDDDDAFSIFIFNAFILSTLARFIMASSDISLTIFISAASNDGPVGGRGGLGGFLQPSFFRFSLFIFFPTNTICSSPSPPTNDTPFLDILP